jgi:hypothetical protein
MARVAFGINFMDRLELGISVMPASVWVGFGLLEIPLNMKQFRLLYERPRFLDQMK